jgi:hypothetical protein
MSARWQQVRRFVSSPRLIIIGYAVMIGALVVARGDQTPLAFTVVLASAGTVLIAILLWLRDRAWTARILEVTSLGVLPAWGLLYSHGGQEKCQVHVGEADLTVFRPLAEPEVYGLIALHLVVVLAYAISRLRPAMLRPAAEATVSGALLAGMAVHAVLAIHFGRWLIAAALFPPLFLPCAAPLFTIVLYGAELLGRLRRRGLEAAARTPKIPADSAYRVGPPQEPLPPEPRVHLPSLARALAVAPVLLGVHAALHALWLGRVDGGIAVVTRTCNYVLSSAPVVDLPHIWP